MCAEGVGVAADARIHLALGQSVSIQLKRQFHTDGYKCFNSIEKIALGVGGGVME